MLRRDFLRNGSVAMAGALLGMGALSRAIAAETRESKDAQAPCIALIIDDIGYNRSGARRFLELGVPMTFAVLPRLARSRELALELHEAGHEVMLHQPMEPFNAAMNPGPGALYVGRDPRRIAGIVDENLEEIPHAAGINNHMGSRFTSSPEDMAAALTSVRARGLFFVDSLTAGSSIAYRTARRMAIAATRRNIFLDTTVDISSIYGQLLKLKRHALACGCAVGIGHPHRETAEAIGRFFHDPAHAGLLPTPVSRMV